MTLENYKKALIESDLNLKLIELALNEDGFTNDLTTNATFLKNPQLKTKNTRATIIAKGELITCGAPLVEMILKIAQIDKQIKLSILQNEGSLIKPKTPWIILEGQAEALLRIERTILNFLMRMSGIATYTAKVVKAIGKTETKILHTRKTAPGHRNLDIYSTIIGGAHPHRRSLDDAILIKENHFRTGASYQDIFEGIELLRSTSKFVEIEVTNFTELKYAISIKPDRIMLDNFSIDDIKKAVMLFGSSVQFEASGGITLGNVAEYANTGVDFISMGSLTHSFTSADLSMGFDFT